VNRFVLKLVRWAWSAVHHGTYGLRRRRRLGSNALWLSLSLAASTFVKNKLGLLESELDGSAAHQRTTMARLQELQKRMIQLVEKK
jgi:hypothetical protein